MLAKSTGAGLDSICRPGRRGVLSVKGNHGRIKGERQTSHDSCI